MSQNTSVHTQFIHTLHLKRSIFTLLSYITSKPYRLPTLYSGLQTFRFMDLYLSFEFVFGKINFFRLKASTVISLQFKSYFLLLVRFFGLTLGLHLENCIYCGSVCIIMLYIWLEFDLFSANI